MNKVFMGFLAIAAIALVVSQAIAGASNSGNNAANSAGPDGVMIIETYSSSAAAVPVGAYASNSNGAYMNKANGNMQPLPGDPGVEVAPVNNATNQPVVVEEDMMIQETEAGE